MPETPFRPTIGIASLRCGDERRVLAIARGGGPSRTNDDLHVYCPLCGCGMSHDAFEPNGRDEGCDDPDCPCHDEDLAPERRYDRP